MNIRFLGAVGTVTGSKYLLTINGKHILVDCGLFQGLKKLRLRNWRSLPIKASNISAVLLTHAHIDHSGYLPRLMKNGFTGPIYATKATYDLCSLLLPDSGHIHEEDAIRANKYGYTKHHPALPLYTREDAEKVLEQFEVVEFYKKIPIISECSATWHRAGHILGASFIKIEADNTELVFSGDIGRFNDPVMKPPEFIKTTDYLVVESTYGDRLHAQDDPCDELTRVINETVDRGGSVLIPAFAVGRAQSILYFLSKLKQNNKIPDIPIFLDSPLAINATDLLCENSQEHKLSKEECEKACSVAKYTKTVKESKALFNLHEPAIIISASGMITGGRVLHHIKHFAIDPKNTILITGYQAEGTRGADLLEGKTALKIHGDIIKIRAQIEYITNLSAHADYNGILQWLQGFEKAPKKVFITHGEPAAAKNLKQEIESKLGWQCYIPKYFEKEQL